MSSAALSYSARRSSQWLHYSLAGRRHWSTAFPLSRKVLLAGRRHASSSTPLLSSINTFNYYSDDFREKRKQKNRKNSTATPSQSSNKPPVPFWMNPEDFDNSTTTTASAAEMDATTTLPAGAPKDPVSLHAAEFLLWFLRHDPAWRDETLKVLNLPKLTKSLQAHLSEAAATAQQQQQQQQNEKRTQRKQPKPIVASNTHDTFYYNWIDSFYTRLVYDGELRREMQPSLDRLVHGGLGEPRFIDRYWIRRLDLPPLEERLKRIEAECSALAKNVPQMEKEWKERHEENRQVQDQLAALDEQRRRDRLLREEQQRQQRQEEERIRRQAEIQERLRQERDEYEQSLWHKFSTLIGLTAETSTSESMSQSAGPPQSNNTNATATLKSTEPASYSIPKTGLLGMTQRLNGPSSHPTSGMKRRLKAQQRSLERKLQSLERRLQNARDQQKKVARQAAKVRREISAKDALSTKDYETVSALIESVHGDVCRVFAAYIEKVHETLFRHYRDLDKHADLSQPQEWFSSKRPSQRKVIFHAGPTNSGKTYEALQRLRQAKRGMYFGPLRLLAAEVYDRLNEMGVTTNLYTGQEQRLHENATHGAATVEMAKTVQSVQKEPSEVVIIDEVQMIADPDRGSAWTRAFLSMNAKEIHVCGGEEAMELLRKLADDCGDEFELRTYQRFSPLEVESASLAESSNSQWDSYAGHIKPGDAVVCFSRKDIFGISREIEAETGYKCCVVYGSLPPETRAEQASKFNDPESGYDILVASDAIGMGLNLNIKRIIFHTVFKHDGSGVVRLSQSEVKQIAGRAGRRNSPFPDGLVVSRHPDDLPYIQQCLETRLAPIRKAGLMPTEDHLDAFSDVMGQSGLTADSIDTKNNLHEILLEFNELASVQNDFFLGRSDDMLEVARLLSPVEGLTIRQKYLLCSAPIMFGSNRSMAALKRFAISIARKQAPELKEKYLAPYPADSFDDLTNLCQIVNEVDLWLWMNWRFPPGSSEENEALAYSLKQQAVRYIDEALLESEKLELDHNYLFTDSLNRQRYQERFGNIAPLRMTDRYQQRWNESRWQDRLDTRNHTVL